MLAQQRKPETHKKDRPHNWTNICKQKIHKEFISKMYKQIIALQYQTNNPIKQGHKI